MSGSYVHEGFAAVERDDLAINTTVTVRVPTALTQRPHLFLGIEFTNAGVPVTPAAGTVTSVSLEEFTSPGVFTAMASGTGIDATLANSIIPLSAAGNFTRVQLITTGLTSCDGITLRMGANKA